MEGLARTRTAKSHYNWLETHDPFFLDRFFPLLGDVELLPFLPSFPPVVESLPSISTRITR